MFGRPRCREWTPLATQQLRLRSLIQIVGYNIRPPENCLSQCSFYLTLHYTTMSAPFYTSEKISSPHPKWKEIDAEITQRMSSTNVIVRIWSRAVDDQEDNPQDSLIQTWGVYFSGLRYIGANLARNFTADCFKSNTLVFQLLGGYFCSYKSLKLDILSPEYEIEPSSLSSHSTPSNKQKESISPIRKTDIKLSQSNSPITKQLTQTKSTHSLNIGSKDTGIYEHSPTSELQGSSSSTKSSKIDLSETAESYDKRNESDWVPKYRYMALNFLKSEIRPSYNVTKLQKLHLLQYSIKKKQEAVALIKESIYKKSALESEDVKAKSKSRGNIFLEELEENVELRNGRLKEEKVPVPNTPRLNLKLNDLLSLKSKPSPYQRAEHVRLTKNLEILRFKRIILSDERDAKLANIRRLKEKYSKLYEDNLDVGTELMQNFHSLSRCNEAIKQTRESCSAVRELAARAHSSLIASRTNLLNGLAEIFHIEQLDSRMWSICLVPLPVCGDDLPRVSSPLGDCAAAGLAAQAATVAAYLLEQPLRYKITLKGSASKILDLTPDLPDPNIPLFTRSGDVNLFRYGMFLLNKCISQLLWGRGQPVQDMRPTLSNLKTLLTAPSNLSDISKLLGMYKSQSELDYPRAHSLRSLVASERGKQGRQFNRFKFQDCVDGQPPQSLLTLQMHSYNSSRSEGSCLNHGDLSTLQSSNTSIMGSDPNISNQSNTISEKRKTLKSHNSDSEINKRNPTSDKVVFTLGNEEIINIEKERLVRMSVNNDDVARSFSDVEKICFEIKDFCSKSKECDVAICKEENEVCVCDVANLENLDLNICDTGLSVATCDKKCDVADVLTLDVSDCEECKSDCDVAKHMYSDIKAESYDAKLTTDIKIFEDSNS